MEAARKNKQFWRIQGMHVWYLFSYHITTPSQNRYGKRYELPDLAILRIRNAALLMKLSRKRTFSTG